MKRGEIYYIKKQPNFGSEQESGRPAIIVSNDRGNKYSSTVEVVYLTTQDKPDMPTHVTIRSTQKLSTALCEQVHTVSKDRVDTHYGRCTDAEMEMIDTALAISLGLNLDTIEPLEVIREVEAKPAEIDVTTETAYIRMEAERDIYKELYESLLKKMTRKQKTTSKD